MVSRRSCVLALLALVLIPADAPASGKKEVKSSVSFHIETDASDNPKMIFPQPVNGQTRYFRRLPEVATKDIVSFSPFPSDTEGYGIMFRLKDNASKRINAITTATQGRWLLAQLNGRVVDAVLIDNPVTDGMLVIWKRAELADIALLDEAFPRIGQENQKKKKKD